MVKEENYKKGGLKHMEEIDDKKQYNKCPNCQSEEIDSEIVNDFFVDEDIIIHKTCNDCFCKWGEQYKMTFQLSVLIDE